MTLSLRITTEKELEFILAAEQHEENKPYVGQWNRLQHLQSLDDPDIGHFIVYDESAAEAVGYIILAGLTSPHDCIEFKRLVVTRKGEGIGRSILQQVKQLAFEEKSINRLWLDVRVKNIRAYQLYIKEGFVEEGVLRQCQKVDGHYESLIVLSMLQSEYRDSLRLAGEED